MEEEAHTEAEAMAGTLVVEVMEAADMEVSIHNALMFCCADETSRLLSQG